MSTSQRKREEIIHILTTITENIYPELKNVWYSWYEYENNAIFTEIHAKFGSATIVRGSSIQSKIDVGKKYKAQMELQNKKGE